MKRCALLLALAPLAWACGTDDPSAVGTLERDRLDLVAETSEPVVERPVAEGDYVQEGTLLVQLDPTRIQARVAQAQGARGRAEARLAELVRGPRRERVLEARARLHGAQGRLETTRADLQRARELSSQGVFSGSQLDQQRALFDEALAARDAARAALDEMLEGTTPEELDQAEAVLSEADAALTEARISLERLSIRAPSDGWIDSLPYEPGERPPAGGVVAVMLADATPYGRVYVPAAIRTRVAPGTPARVRVDGVDEPLRGRVRTVATDASFTPYFALTERDRGRLVYLAKVDLVDPVARSLPAGVPVVVEFDLQAEPAPGAPEAIDVGSRR